MAGVDGEYACVTDTPMGPQNSVLSVKSDGAGGFTGVNAGTLGSLDVVDGRVDGNVLRWKMEMTSPMPMTLHATATIDGDALTGEIKLGAFGTAAMRGTRK
jgi:hypothetical protein